jgi:hypothetical protein
MAFNEVIGGGTSPAIVVLSDRPGAARFIASWLTACQRVLEMCPPNAIKSACDFCIVERALLPLMTSADISR